MLSVPTLDITFDLDNDDWVADPPTTRLYRAASVGNSWGVTSIGRGFDWEKSNNGTDPSDEFLQASPKLERSISDYFSDNKRRKVPRNSPNLTRRITPIAIVAPHIPQSPSTSMCTDTLFAEPISMTDQSLPASPCPLTPGSVANDYRRLSDSHTPPSPRPRPRRRSSQRRVSLIAGCISIIDAPPSPIMLPQTLQRTASSVSIISSAAPAQPPENQSFLGERNISEFVIEREIGRGAYGLVKRAREIQGDGSLGVSYFQCWLLPVEMLSVRIASARYQTNHQVSYTCRLLEAAPKVRNDSDRDLRYVSDLRYFLRTPCTPTLGSRTSLPINIVPTPQQCPEF